MTEPEYTEDDLRMFAAWSDYRKEYGAYGIEAHSQFTAGWEAARDGVQGGDFLSKDYEAGFLAYHGELDIGGVLR